MNRHHTRSQARGPSVVPDPMPWNPVVAIGRNRLALAGANTAAVLRCAQNLRIIQEQALHQVVLRRQQLSGELQLPSERAAFWSRQSESCRVELASLAQVCQRMAAAALLTQFELVGCALDWLDTESDGLVTLALQDQQPARDWPASTAA